MNTIEKFESLLKIGRLRYETIHVDQGELITQIYTDLDTNTQYEVQWEISGVLSAEVEEK